MAEMVSILIALYFITPDSLDYFAPLLSSFILSGAVDKAVCLLWTSSLLADASINSPTEPMEHVPTVTFVVKKIWFIIQIWKQQILQANLSYTELDELKKHVLLYYIY